MTGWARPGYSRFMVWLFLIIASTQTVDLGPPLKVQSAVSLRTAPGTKAPKKIKSTLMFCSQITGVSSPWNAPLEIRVVKTSWLNTHFKTPAGTQRKGRYYPAKKGHPALIYIASGRDLKVSLAHEWLHHLAAVHGKGWSESWIESTAKHCAQ